ncbi:MAG: hypothetical protein N2Z20_02200 [Elusimicrobiales bacterium]|nr:hypothetical protein [Elusimicrobiales bacterium]
MIFILVGWFFLFFSNNKSFTLRSYFKRIYQKIKEHKESTILFHFSSLGEMNAAKPLINYFVNAKKNIVITVFTETAYKEAFNISENVYYIPFDFYFIVKRFIKKINPSIVFVTETEIWPMFIKLASLYSRVIWINGKMSEKSYSKYLLIKPIVKFILKNIEKVFVQTEKDMKYFSTFLIKEKIYVAGNTKYDNLSMMVDEDLTNKILSWKRGFFCIVFGSVHPDEFETIVKSYKLLKSESIDIKYIIVPRHIEKMFQFTKILEEYNFSYIRFSEYENNLSNIKADILIFDKLGFLSKLYYVCDIAFVGGTLNNIGGHNLIEPSIYSKPVLFGPNYFSQKTSGFELITKGGGFIVLDEYDIKARIKFFISNKQKLNDAGKKSFNVLKNLSGATDKIIKNILI